MRLMEMSLLGSCAIAAAAALRPLASRRLPGLLQVLWSVALARLLIPFSLPFRGSVWSLLARGGRIAPPSGAGFPWRVLWLAGAAAAALVFAGTWLVHRRVFHTAEPVEDPFVQAWLRDRPLRRPIAVRRSDRVDTPLTYGFLRPVILLPSWTDWGDRKTLFYVLTHERIHIERAHALFRLALIAAVCVHWYNPLVWLMYVLACRDMELACDAAVVRRLGPESRKPYAMALLAMEEARLHASLFPHFARDAAGARLRAIMEVRDPTVSQIVLSICSVLCVFGFFCTSAVPAEAAEPAEVRAILTPMQERHLAAWMVAANGLDLEIDYAAAMRDALAGGEAETDFSGCASCAVGFAKLEEGWTGTIRVFGRSTFQSVALGILDRSAGEVTAYPLSLEEGSAKVDFQAPSTGTYDLLLWNTGYGESDLTLQGSVTTDQGVTVHGVLQGRFSSSKHRGQ